MTDVWRVDFMIKYGGIYVDTDVVFVRPLERDIRGYDAVGSYDWTYWNHPFPDTINFGVALGKRNAPYWHKFQVSGLFVAFPARTFSAAVFRRVYTRESTFVPAPL